MRSAREILATLHEPGMVDRLTFMESPGLRTSTT
jgi:hypothetical protein